MRVSFPEHGRIPSLSLLGWFVSLPDARLHNQPFYIFLKRLPITSSVLSEYVKRYAVMYVGLDAILPLSNPINHRTRVLG